MKRVVRAAIAIFAIGFSSLVAAPANAHSLTTYETLSMSVSSSATLPNTTGQCASSCTWSFDVGSWTGSASLSGQRLVIGSPAQLNAATRTFTLSITARKSSGDLYTTVWTVIVNDPNYPYSSPPPPPGPAPVQQLPSVYTVYCDAVTNGGSPSASLTVTFASGQTLRVICPGAQRDGYTFNGWFTAPTGGTLMTFPTSVSSSTTYYAQWTPLATVTTNLSITCDAVTNGGSVTPTTLTYTPGSAGVSCAAPASRSGYVFSGWFTSPSGGSAVTFPVTPSTSTTYYAQWTRIFTVTCDATTNGGSVSPVSLTYTPGQSGVTCASPASRDGYTFTGWFTSATGGSRASFPATVSGNTTYYAQWEKAFTSKTSELTVYYCFDCRKLSTTAKSQLRSFANDLPDDATEIVVEVIGYAQVGRSEAYDLKLSTDRARAIVAYLKSLGLKARFKVSGEGWDDATAQARRGEIVVTYLTKS